MLRRLLFWGLTVGLVVWNLSSCGSSPTPAPVPGTGALVTIVEDAPVWDVLAFRPTITGLTVAFHDGSGGRSLVSSASPPKINFADLKDFSGVLSVLALPA